MARPRGGGCDGTFRDEFNTAAFSNSDGTLSWAGDWQEVGEGDGAGSGDVQVLNDASDYQLRLRENVNGGEGVALSANLAGATSATLSLGTRREGLDNASDYVMFEISSAGFSGPWSEITRFEGSGTDGAYTSESYDITPYISADTAIRLQTSPNMGVQDRVWFDNIQIQCTP